MSCRTGNRPFTHAHSSSGIARQVSRRGHTAHSLTHACMGCVWFVASARVGMLVTFLGVQEEIENVEFSENKEIWPGSSRWYCFACICYLLPWKRRLLPGATKSIRYKNSKI